MTILVIAEHDNATLSRPDRQGLVGRAEDRRRRRMFWSLARTPQAAAEAAAKLTGVRKVLLAEADELASGSPNLWQR